MKLYDYRTRKLLAIIGPKSADLNQWCEAKGYLPHSKVNGGWLMIADHVDLPL